MATRASVRRSPPLVHIMSKMYVMAMKPTATAEKKARRIKAAPRTEARRVERLEDIRAPLAMAVARAHLAEHLNRVEYAGERIIIGKRGKPVAALVPMADLETLRALEDAIDLEAARKARREGGKSIPHSEVLALLGIGESDDR
jgi:prevent-host-death family protein